MTTAVLQLKINGGAPQTGGVIANLGDVVQPTASDKTGWASTRWELYDYPPGYPLPSGWTQDVDDVQIPTYFVLGNSDPPAFTMTLWGKYKTRLSTNNGTKSDESTAVSVLSPSGLRDFVRSENSQFGGPKGVWVLEEKRNLRVIESVVSGVADVNIDSFTSGTAAVVASAGGHINRLSGSVAAVALPKATSALLGKAIICEVSNNVDIPALPTAVTKSNIAVTFAAGGHTLTRSVGSWIADGHFVGETLVITGTGLNNVTAIITGVTATVITCAATTFVSELNLNGVYTGNTDTVNGAQVVTIPGATDPERTVVTFTCDAVGSWTFGGNGGYRQVGIARNTAGVSGAQVLSWSDGPKPHLHMSANGSISFGSIPQRGEMTLRLECDSGVTSVTFNAATIFTAAGSFPGSGSFTAAALASVCSNFGALGGYNIEFELRAWGGIVFIHDWTVYSAVITTFTNQCLKSEKFGTSPWVVPATGHQSIIADVITAPDGSSNADALNALDTVSADRYVDQPELTIVGAYAFSCYVKAGSTHYVALVADGTFDFVFFDVSGAGAVSGVYGGGGATGGIEPASVTIPGAGSDWYRCYMVGSRAHTNFQWQVHAVGGTGSPGNEVYAPGATGALLYLWGAQVVHASIPGDYVATP